MMLSGMQHPHSPRNMRILRFSLNLNKVGMVSASCKFISDPTTFYLFTDTVCLKLYFVVVKRFNFII
jgi:hypothetical protein